MNKWTAWYFATLVCIGCSDSVDGQGRPADSDPLSLYAQRNKIGPERPLAKADQACPNFPSYFFRYLDDTRCTKLLPSNRERDLTCPNTADSTAVTHPITGQSVEYVTAEEPIVVDTTTLAEAVPDSIKMTLILIKRVEGVPYYRYLSNGTHTDIIQPWSSTKFMAIANAAATLRTATNGQIGLDGSVGDLPLGDLVTVIHNYDEREHKSNALAAWFHTIGRREQANHLIHDGWLNRPKDESFGGNYGMSAPRLGPAIEKDDASLVITEDTSQPVDNQLSTLTMAEFLKRLVMHRENETTRLPGLTWNDIAILLYGAPDSVWFEPGQPQGMESDTAVYVQNALDAEQLDRTARGQWRVFSKLGFGVTAHRGAEFVHNAYACLPQLSAVGTPTGGIGTEFVVSMFLATPTRDAAAGDAELAAAYRIIVNGIVDGTIR